MHPTFLHIGGFELASYGLMTALGYAAASFYLLPRAKKINIDADTFWNLIFIIFAGALIGAKLMFIVLHWGDMGATFSDRFINVFKNFRYGFVFFGGVILAISGVMWYIRRKKLPMLKTMDFMIVGLPLGHALGRIGCFLAGCCYGKPTTMPWGVTFTDPHSLVPDHLLGVALHPTQLYESALNLLLFIFLHFSYKKPHKDGKILAQYLVFYGLMRFSIEFFRGDFRGGFFLGMSPSQLISLGTCLAALLIWLKFLRTSKNG